MACKITNSFAIKKIFHPTFSKTYKKKVPFCFISQPAKAPPLKGESEKKDEHSFFVFFPTRRPTIGR